MAYSHPMTLTSSHAHPLTRAAMARVVLLKARRAAGSWGHSIPEEGTADHALYLLAESNLASARAEARIAGLPA